MDLNLLITNYLCLFFHGDDFPIGLPSLFPSCYYHSRCNYYVVSS